MKEGGCDRLECPKNKEKHLITWTPQDDDAPRLKLSLKGTDKQELNSQVKKAGWSAEEDMLLCKAQKLYGNRWTEIAKCFSGRTDNAVKNRFAALSKKMAKQVASLKESSKKDVSTSVNDSPKKAKLTNTLTQPEVYRPETSHVRTRYPLGTIDPIVHSMQHNHMVPQGACLKKDDRKLPALMQQAELLSTLAQDLQKENRSPNNAWKVFQDFLNHRKESKEVAHDMSANDGREFIYPSINEGCKGELPVSSTVEFGSPIQVNPLFRSIAEGIPTPTFSESEKSFLLKAFKVQPSSPTEQPCCKRSLIHNLSYSKS